MTDQFLSDLEEKAWSEEQARLRVEQARENSIKTALKEFILAQHGTYFLRHPADPRSIDTTVDTLMEGFIKPFNVFCQNYALRAE